MQAIFFIPLFMPDFSNFTLLELFDLLTVYTKIYTRILSMNILPSEKFLYTKGIVEQLQLEIQSRVPDININANVPASFISLPTVP